MSGSDIWKPAPRIMMEFSQFAPGSRDVLLAYSTDTENADSNKAKEQANILAEWHLENTPTYLRTRKWKDSVVRCALFNDHSILIKDIGIIPTQEQGNETGAEAQWLISVSPSDAVSLMGNMLRLPSSSFENSKLEGDEWELRIQTQIGFAEWQTTVGKSHHSARVTVQFTQASLAGRIIGKQLGPHRSFSTPRRLRFWCRRLFRTRK